MAGVKGKSGRRPLAEEILKRAVLRKSWEITGEFLGSKDYGLDKKVEQAVKIVTRDIPEQHEHSGNVIIKYGHRSSDSTIRD